jgi:hypothetical protein
MPKSVRTTLALDQKFFKAKNTIIRTFNLVPKKNGRIFSPDQIIKKTFDLLKKSGTRLNALLKLSI